MSLSYGAVVACNNLISLKGMFVYLTNQCIYEKPSAFTKWVYEKAKAWIERKALKEFEDIKAELKSYALSVGINDCQTAIFTCLYLADRQNIVGPDKMKIKTGQELFQTIASMELEFEKMKKQKQDITHE